MRKFLLATPILILAGAAQAQVSATNNNSAYDTVQAGQAGDAPAKPLDEGRFLPNDRDGLTSRGGRADTEKTYSTTLGQPMGTTFSTTMGSTLPLSQPR